MWLGSRAHVHRIVGILTDYTIYATSEYLPIPTPRKRLRVSPFLNFSAMNLSKGRTMTDNRPLDAWRTESALKKCPHVLHRMSESPVPISMMRNSNSCEVIDSSCRKNLSWMARLVTALSEHPWVRIESIRRLRQRERSTLSGTSAQHFHISLVPADKGINRAHRLGALITSW